ncbi:MAG: GH92 family glycosyl hydrolase [Bacteroidetes bacterium]|uniref:GH92 family glycosyl hydrolase n=1 Tax=Candidatus Cryptobacteroides excrementavium TaxID=2840759 RepID=A0A9D9J2B1_9BACT|nr:GH92 family glycosyl hydrolase [Candidatus Cryptobacteroides excrementavium]
MNRIPIVFAVAAFLSAGSAAAAVSDDVLQYVDPFIGTTNFGTTNPGAVCPNGLMSVSPFNVMGSDLNVYDKDSRWWSTPYCYENRYFTGFSHVNLSGVGCPELGSLLTMPTTGPLNVDYHVYGSEYSDEQASPGYYTNVLSAYGVKTEVTATMRTSAERYTFPAGQGNILVNLGEGLTNETGAFVRKVSDTEIEGMRLLGTFCYNPQAVFPVYFVLRVSKAPKEAGYWKKQRPMTGVEAEWTPDNGKYKLYTKYGRELAGDDIGYWFTFDTEEGEQIELQMGVSFVSMENARENLDAEQDGFDFDAVRSRAEKMWAEDLSRIRVHGGTLEQKTVFYTGLYHALIHPNILNDVNGEYPLMENDGVGTVPAGHNRYTVFSLWDTYRNLHQLMTLLYPERQLDMVRSMIGIYEEWGWMPKWELYGRETFTMEGDPAIPVIADTWFKGLKDFDIETAYAAFVKSATTPGAENRMRPDVDPYIEKGYIPLGVYAADLSGDNAVSHALEYYIADHALSLLADSLGHKEDAARFRKASLGYRHYYCPEYGTLRPLMKDGSFYSPFNPRQGENFETAPGFHEGSAWNYTFYVPHDVKGLARLMGGKKKFIDKLQMVFDEGLYDPANEPDIAYPYLFSYFPGEEWRTQKTVTDLLSKYYRAEPDGIPGNDDTGTMSAWAVFSMMGFYPDCPGEPHYTLVAPVFDKVEISLDPEYAGGKEVLVIENNAEGYATGVTAGGRPLKGFRISHSELTGAGTLTFE